MLPFLWNVVAREGQIFGDSSKGSLVRVTNGLWFSYPGYNEMLSGAADPRVDPTAQKLERATFQELLQRGLKVVLDGRVFQANTGRLDELKAMLKPGGKGIVCLSMMLEDRHREVEIAMPGRFDISPAQKGAISTVPWVLEVVDI